MTGRHEEPIPEPSPGLFESVRGFAGTLLEIVETRVELVTTEIQEELQRAAELVLWSAVALLAGSIGTLLLAICVILAFWEHRLVAGLAVTAAFLVACGVAIWFVRAKIAARPRLLATTLSELKKDRALVERP